MQPQTETFPIRPGPMGTLASRLLAELEFGGTTAAQGELIREVLRFAAQAEDAIGAREQRIHALQSQTTLDDVTGLENERGLRVAFARASAASARYGSGNVLALFAVNGLDDIQERYGRSIELWLLQQLASELRRQTRKSDVLARTGRSEFAVLLTPCPAEHAATKTATIAAALGALDLPFQNQSLSVKVSGGYAAFAAEAQFERVTALAHQVLARRWQPQMRGSFGRRSAVAKAGDSL